MSRAPQSPTTGSLFVTIVLDGVGVGAQPDSAQYGDGGANTLAHVCESESPELPHLTTAGLGNVLSLEGIPPVPEPEASWGRMKEHSAGKDSTTGHWELAGLRLDEPFPTFPERFPDDLVEAFTRETGVSGVLGNEVASGTEIIGRLGAAHLETGFPIVYTSADSVFQVAAHVDVTPVTELWAWCQVARKRVCVGPHNVGRVIARPFKGEEGAFVRLSEKRRDYSRLPEAPTLLDRLQARGVRTVSIGKVADLFGRVGFDETHKTGRNAVGIACLIDWLLSWDGRDTFVWVNLIDFDQEFGHRNDPAGFAAALEEFDAALPAIRAHLPEGTRLVLTADHGNDPTTPGTDHTREYVPLLSFGSGEPRDLGTRPSFNDHAATVAGFFGIDWSGPGSGF